MTNSGPSRRNAKASDGDNDTLVATVLVVAVSTVVPVVFGVVVVCVLFAMGVLG
jgi:hypothetical protein